MDGRGGFAVQCFFLRMEGGTDAFPFFPQGGDARPPFDASHAHLRVVSIKPRLGNSCPKQQGLLRLSTGCC